MVINKTKALIALVLSVIMSVAMLPTAQAQATGGFWAYSENTLATDPGVPGVVPIRVAPGTPPAQPPRYALDPSLANLPESTLAYCFNMNYVWPTDEQSWAGDTPPEFSKIVDTVGAEFGSLATSNFRGTPEALRADVLTYVYNGMNDDGKDVAGIQSALGLTGYEFYQATQYAIWDATDKPFVDEIADWANSSTPVSDKVQAATRILLGENPVAVASSLGLTLNGLVELQPVPDATLELFATTDKDKLDADYQNLLGASFVNADGTPYVPGETTTAPAPVVTVTPTQTSTFTAPATTETVTTIPTTTVTTETIASSTVTEFVPTTVTQPTTETTTSTTTEVIGTTETTTGTATETTTVTTIEPTTVTQPTTVTEPTVVTEMTTSTATSVVGTTETTTGTSTESTTVTVTQPTTVTEPTVVTETTTSTATSVENTTETTTSTVKETETTTATETSSVTATKTVPVTTVTVPTTIPADAPFVEIDKVNLGGEELAGAGIEIKDKDGNIVHTWISKIGENSKFQVVPGTYTFHEEVAPNGYLAVTDITFTVDKDGNVTVDNANGNTVVWQDGVLVVTDEAVPANVKPIDISKVNLGGKEIGGADIRIINEKGQEVAKWTSEEDQTHRVELAPGVYTFIEDAAPAGYEKVTNITFLVEEDGTVSVVNDAGNKVVADGAKLTVTDLDKAPTPGPNPGPTPGDNGSSKVPWWVYLTPIALIGGGMLSSGGSSEGSSEKPDQQAPAPKPEASKPADGIQGISDAPQKGIPADQVKQAPAKKMLASTGASVLGLSALAALMLALGLFFVAKRREN
ncbi:SpaA isopeptide-forming pilin-related protein [Corynebacterium sp. H130]|uniref:SpaA isopeptide-forming pilin-related protein n=1 Tax=Corynebacterium sp. H130 TaxID=3133444 RepID=UPI0030B0D63A